MKTLLILLCIAAHSFSFGSETARLQQLPDQLAEANNSFAVELHVRLAEQPGNLLVCPCSVAVVSALSYAGARGETARQMADTLRLPPAARSPEIGFAPLLSELKAANVAGCEFDLANSIWTQEGLRLQPSFQSVCRDKYAASLKQVSFQRNPEAARKQINDWVANNTHSMITELVPPHSVHQDTVLSVVNAAYFYGSWATKFPKERTEERRFHLTSGESVLVPMMQSQNHFRYAETESVQAVELPYTSNRFSMMVLLPKQEHTLAQIERELSVRVINDLRTNSNLQAVAVFLPRFRISSSLNLKQTMIAMGMVDAFTLGRADFSAVPTEKGLPIDMFLHGATLNVDEEGTLAAAASYKGISKSIAVPFIADHPFMFAIIHNPTGAIVFVGRLCNPGSNR